MTTADPVALPSTDRTSPWRSRVIRAVVLAWVGLGIYILAFVGNVYIIGVGSLVGVGGMLGLGVLEQIVPLHREWSIRPGQWRRALKEIGIDLVCTFGVPRVWGPIIHILYIDALQRLLFHRTEALRTAIGWHPWPGGAPYIVRVLLVMVGMEFFSYWMHRLYHNWSPLWRFHSTHHMITSFSVTRGGRANPVDTMLIDLPGQLALVLLGAPERECVGAGALGGLLAALAHANLDCFRGGIFGWFFVSPWHHSIHHSVELEESKSNFGCRLLLWDHVFRTFRGQPSEGMRLGIKPERARSMLEQFAGPFYKPRIDGL
jgi:sterol desaturase/sphingolipid hydroxylase (fatty acid hydroxylase superfamily)